MSYCVLVKISKQNLSFWYQIEGGNYVSFGIKDSGVIPLCFYVSGNDFHVGSFAKQRAVQNDPHTFSNYFDLIKDPALHFNLHGDLKPAKLLLYYGIENHLSHFIKTVLFKHDSIESFRQHFCLRFWFDEDIEDHEKKMLHDLFAEAGYENVSEVSIGYLLNNVITDVVQSRLNRIVLSSLNNDLFLTFYDSKTGVEIHKNKIAGLGSDPRANILAQLII